MTDALHVLNVSGGVQSSTLAYMAVEGDGPLPDVAVFADTRWEYQRTYAQVEYVEDLLGTIGVPLIRTDVGSVPERVIEQPTRHFVTMPAWTLTPDGRAGKMREVCTVDYKVRPIRRAVRALMEQRGLKRVVQYLGVSWEERRRVRPSDVRFVDLVYPLVDARIDRDGCLAYARDHGYQEPAQSSCVGCPLHTNETWQWLKENEPENWADAVRVDEAIRHGGGRGTPLAGEAFLHRSRVPLAEADLRTPEQRGQGAFDFGGSAG
jgi:hypothetical protein